MAWGHAVERAWWDQVFVTSVAWPALWWTSGVMSDAWTNSGMDIVAPNKRVVYWFEGVAYFVMMCAVMAAIMAYWV